MESLKWFIDNIAWKKVAYFKTIPSPSYLGKEAAQVFSEAVM